MVEGKLHAARGQRFVGLVLAGLMTLTVVACSSPDSSSTPGGTTGGSDSSPTSITSPSPTSPADSARQQAIATYSAMWQAMAKASETSDWQSPELAKYATGDALGVINRSLYTDHLNGVVTKGTPKINPQASNVDPKDNPTTVMISDCGDDSDWVKYKGDKPLNDEPGGRRSITAEVKKQSDGSWKVTRFAVEAVGTC